MRLLLAFLAGMLLFSNQARAAEIVTSGTISDGGTGFASVDLPMFQDPGVYSAKVTFSAPAQSLYLLYAVNQNYVFYCDFGDGGGFVQCGGNDVPIGFDTFAGTGATSISLIYKILEPYRIDYSPEMYELGSYIAAGARFEYEFLADGTVDYTATTTRLAAIPEPATWTLLILGFAAIGATLRRSPSAARHGHAIEAGGGGGRA